MKVTTYNFHNNLYYIDSIEMCFSTLPSLAISYELMWNDLVDHMRMISSLTLLKKTINIFVCCNFFTVTKCQHLSYLHSLIPIFPSVPLSDYYERKSTVPKAMHSLSISVGVEIPETLITKREHTCKSRFPLPGQALM